jgi:hypothetical protein
MPDPLRSDGRLSIGALRQTAEEARREWRVEPLLRP